MKKKNKSNLIEVYTKRVKIKNSLITKSLNLVIDDNPSIKNLYINKKDVTSIDRKKNFIALNSLYMTEGTILIFDINDNSSFEVILDLFLEIKRSKNYKKRPLVLVGNIKNEDMDKREVLYEKALRIALKNNIKYYEISVKNDINQIEEIFNDLINKFLLRDEVNITEEIIKMKNINSNPLDCLLDNSYNSPNEELNEFDLHYSSSDNKFLIKNNFGKSSNSSSNETNMTINISPFSYSYNKNRKKYFTTNSMERFIEKEKIISEDGEENESQEKKSDGYVSEFVYSDPNTSNEKKYLEYNNPYLYKLVLDSINSVEIKEKDKKDNDLGSFLKSSEKYSENKNIFSKESEINFSLIKKNNNDENSKIISAFEETIPDIIESKLFSNSDSKSYNFYYDLVNQ